MKFKNCDILELYTLTLISVDLVSVNFLRVNNLCLSGLVYSGNLCVIYFFFFNLVSIEAEVH